jgi:16S rRNA (guanine527-N7)-methyltransferase
LEERYLNTLRDGALSLGIALDGEALGKFGLFADELINWNKVMNLTSITEPEEIVEKHFIDSLSVLKYASPKKGNRVIDVGSGAGFPGIPIKIVRGDVSLFCLDSLGKRLEFISSLVDKLGLTGCETLHARAEEAGRLPDCRENFDFCVSRAVAKLPMLAEYCLPLVRRGGVFVAMKGPGGEDEAKKAARAIATLGGETEKVESFRLPGGDERSLIVIRKISSTAQRFPRSQARINKDPL